MAAMTTTEVESEKATSRRTVKVYGRYIVADSGICHGKLTFRGTRIMVATVLDQVARGLSWTEIEEQWDGQVTGAAASEAVRLAKAALLAHAHEMPVAEAPVELGGG